MQTPLADCAGAAKPETGARCMVLTVTPTQRSEGKGCRALGAGLPRAKEVAALLTFSAAVVETESEALLDPVGTLAKRNVRRRQGLEQGVCGPAPPFCGEAALCLFSSRPYGPLALCCCLTFELSGRQRQDARPGLAKMYRVPPDRAWWGSMPFRVERDSLI